MQYWLSLALWPTLFFSAPAGSNERSTVPIVDKSASGSPLEISGTARLEQHATANQLEWSWGERIFAKNASHKEILLFIATLNELGGRGNGQRAAPGDGPTYEIDDDRFFSETVIKPGESLVIRDTVPGTQNVACCINPLDATEAPRAEFRLIFVQFSDGSTFGDSEQATEALAARNTIMNGLRELLQSYAQGSSAFVTKLKESSSFSGTAPHRRIFAKYEEGGLPASVAETQRLLGIAERHEAMLSRAIAP
jgi:hypothetical protein